MPGYCTETMTESMVIGDSQVCSIFATKLQRVLGSEKFLNK